MTTQLPKNCAECPFARELDNNRFVCTVAATANDVVRGHWSPASECLAHFSSIDNNSQGECADSESPEEKLAASMQKTINLAETLDFRAQKQDAYTAVVWAGQGKETRKFYVETVTEHCFFVLDDHLPKKQVETRLQAFAEIERRVYNHTPFTF